MVAPITRGRGGQKYGAGTGNIVRRGRAGEAMRTSLLAIAKKARERKDLRFFNLYRLIDEALLLDCWRDIRKNAAFGVDGISAEEYGENLTGNIRDLASFCLETAKTAVGGGFQAGQARRFSWSAE